MGRPDERPADLPEPGRRARPVRASWPRLLREEEARAVDAGLRASGRRDRVRARRRRARLRRRVAGGRRRGASARRSTSTAGAAHRERPTAAYDAAFAAVPHRICYAVKANGNGAILRLLAGLGAGADIVSGGELLAALRAGFAPERIVFAGVGKTDDEIALGLERGIADFNVESEAEIERIAAVAAARGHARRASRCASTRTSTRARTPTSRPGCARASSAWTSTLRPAILRSRPRAAGDRGGRRAVPHRLADHGPRAVEEAARALAALAASLLRRGFALRDARPRRRPRRRLRAAAACPTPRPSPPRVLPERPRACRSRWCVEPGRSLVGAAGVAAHARALREGEPRQALRGRRRGHERPAATRRSTRRSTGSSRSARGGGRA